VLARRSSRPQEVHRAFSRQAAERLKARWQRAKAWITSPDPVAYGRAVGF